VALKFLNQEEVYPVSGPFGSAFGPIGLTAKLLDFWALGFTDELLGLWVHPEAAGVLGHLGLTVKLLDF
jgi:hypothetical protein